MTPCPCSLGPRIRSLAYVGMHLGVNTLTGIARSWEHAFILQHNMNIIVTPRLLLRPFDVSDLPDLTTLFADAEVMRFIGPVRTPKESHEKLQKMMGDFERDGFGMFAVVDRREKKFVGRCGLQPLAGTGLLELGYTFMPSAWGKGYASEAAKAVIHKAFEEWNLEEVVAVALPENTASIHVMEKLGMQYDCNKTFYGKVCAMYRLSVSEQIQPSKRPYSPPKTTQIQEHPNQLDNG